MDPTKRAEEEKISRIIVCLLQEMPARAIFFLSQSGCWQKNPLTWRDMAVHEFLYRIRQDPEAQARKFGRAVFTLNEEFGYELLNKIRLGLSRETFSLGRLVISQEELQAEFEPAAANLSLEPEDGRFTWSLFLSVLEVVAQLILYRAFRMNAAISAAAWDSEATRVKLHFQEEASRWESNLAQALSEAEKSLWPSLVQKIETSLGRIVAETASFLAEEQRFWAALGHLLDRLRCSGGPDEIYSLIREKFQPPGGIVSEMTAAGFYPALCLLLDPRVDVYSGIQYAAAVALSLFQDKRSCDYLVFCLESFPVFWTKIRENIIYTLGQLRDEQAVWAIARILQEPDYWQPGTGEEGHFFPLLEQKEEAIWALGKIGWEAARTIPLLSSYAEHPSARLKAYLAWSLGEIGKAQKQRTGGVKADVLIALLKLLQEKNKEVFEETTNALNKLGLPDFIHSLYLYHVGAVSLLGLKPAARGLNELAASLSFLLTAKRQTVMAVTGDSGTGKTYFCQVLASGFSGISQEEILYLMRDSKDGRKVFNNLLGRNWLKKYIDPTYYEADVEDQTCQSFWDRFIQENRQKRLIILDGCRDRHYFQRVVDLFYERGELDVVVNFRANFSTRRLNLEAREVALESVRLHLSFLEEPSLENTYFYHEGKIILYDLDNSVSSRLGQEEIRELFSGRKISRWEEFIYLGSFEPEEKVEAEFQERLSLEERPLSFEEDQWPEKRTLAIFYKERLLKPGLNEDLGEEPHLLSTVFLPELRPEKIGFYAQEQAAGTDETGKIFIYTLNDNRLFFLSLPQRVQNFCLLGRTFFFPEGQTNLVAVSLEKEEMSKYSGGKSAIQAMASMPSDQILTAESDGSVKLWNLEEKRITTLRLGNDPLTSVAADPMARICFVSANRAGLVDSQERILLLTDPFAEELLLAQFLSRGEIVAAVRKKENNLWGIRILNFHLKTTRLFLFRGVEAIRKMIVGRDGRIIFIGQEKNPDSSPGCFLYILTPENDGFSLTRINKNPSDLRDVILLGPKLLTCGLGPGDEPCFQVWGSKFFVQAELSKLRIKPY